MSLLSVEKSIRLESACSTSSSKANNVLAYRFHRCTLGSHKRIKCTITGFPLQRTLLIFGDWEFKWTFTLCLWAANCIILLAIVFCLSPSGFWAQQQVRSPYWIESWMTSLWPRERHQCGLCPAVRWFSWVKEQGLALKDQGQWNNIVIHFLFNQCGVLRPCTRLFWESYWEGFTLTFYWQSTVLDTLDPILANKTEDSTGHVCAMFQLQSGCRSWSQPF